MTHQPHPILEHLWKRGTDFLGCSYGIMGGAMTWISNRYLVSALSNAGAFGVLAAGAMPPKALAEEINVTKRMSSRPFGVNLIIMHPDLDAMVTTCIDHQVSHVILAGGLPHSSTIQRLKDHNIKVMSFAPALTVAKKLIKQGIDALIIEGMEAGGHIGPVSTQVLAQEILPHIHDVPIFVAGGIGRGDSMVSFLRMGAAGCQLGTAFVCATESTAHPNFKQAFIRAHARDAVATVQLDPRFPVIPVRALINEGTAAFLDTQRDIISKVDQGMMSLAEGQLAIEHYWAGALRRAAIDGDVKTGSLMAGQSVGMVKKEQPIAEILDDLIKQANDHIEKNQ